MSGASDYAAMIDLSLNQLPAASWPCCSSWRFRCYCSTCLGHQLSRLRALAALSRQFCGPHEESERMSRVFPNSASATATPTPPDSPKPTQPDKAPTQGFEHV